ncbi:MAG: hypothetical protein Q4P36_00055 [Bowdeniella nasicola]|nr:hypothetical protein [Bowdeniella nasicola]
MIEILTVCTGNICRSPVAERLLQRAVDAHAPGLVRVRSAGTAALVGEPVAPEMAALLDARGVDATGLIARQLTPNDVAAATVVLTATVDHSADVVRLSPRALKKVFTLGRFADILAYESRHDLLGLPHGDTPDTIEARWRLIGRDLTALRAVVPSGTWDIADPYGRGPAAHRAAFDAISRAVGAIARAEEHYASA